jgi:hypothetical protein
MRICVLVAMVGCCFAAIANAAEPEAAELAPQIMVSLRICEGKPGGKERDTMVLTAPRITMHDGQQGQISVGGEKAEFAKLEERVGHGIDCQVTPKLVKDGEVLLKLRCEFTELIDDKRKDSVTAQGTFLRSSLVVKPGETVKVGGLERAGKKVWLEATVDIIPPGDVLTLVQPR